jgi:hypothetical protein
MGSGKHDTKHPSQKKKRKKKKEEEEGKLEILPIGQNKETPESESRRDHCLPLCGHTYACVPPRA